MMISIELPTGMFAPSKKGNMDRFVFSFVKHQRNAHCPLSVCCQSIIRASGWLYDRKRRAAISGAGIFKDEASDALVRQIFFDGAIRNWQVIVPDFGTVTGPFQLSSLEYRGDHAGEVTFDLSLESAGQLAFAAL